MAALHRVPATHRVLSLSLLARQPRRVLNPYRLQVSYVKDSPIRTSVTLQCDFTQLFDKNLDFDGMSSYSCRNIEKLTKPAFWDTSRRKPPSGSKALPWNPLNCKLSLPFPKRGGASKTGRSQAEPGNENQRRWHQRVSILEILFWPDRFYSSWVTIQ